MRALGDQEMEWVSGGLFENEGKPVITIADTPDSTGGSLGSTGQGTAGGSQERISAPARHGN